MIEESLWNVIRTIDENVMLTRHMAEHLRDTGNANAAEAFLKKAEEAQRRSDLVRQAMTDENGSG